MVTFSNLHLLTWVDYYYNWNSNDHTLIDLLLFLFKVFESFVDYVAVEQLDGDNKYDAGEHGLQVMRVPF